jgi:putative oxidoreductase
MVFENAVVEGAHRERSVRIDATQGASDPMLHTVSYVLLNGVGGAVLTYVGARIATGVFFVFSGYHKLTNANRRAVFVATLQASDIPFIPFMQWFVPGVEFLGGLGVAFGFLTPLAALGLATICLVAACTDGMPRVRASGAIDRVDVIDDVLYLPEVLYMVLLALFVANGAGPFSLDAILSRYL